MVHICFAYREKRITRGGERKILRAISGMWNRAHRLRVMALFARSKWCSLTRCLCVLSIVKVSSQYRTATSHMCPSFYTNFSCPRAYFLPKWKIKCKASRSELRSSLIARFFLILGKFGTASATDGDQACNLKIPKIRRKSANPTINQKEKKKKKSRAPCSNNYDMQSPPKSSEIPALYPMNLIAYIPPPSSLPLLFF